MCQRWQRLICSQRTVTGRQTVIKSEPYRSQVNLHHKGLGFASHGTALFNLWYVGMRWRFDLSRPELSACVPSAGLSPVDPMVVAHVPRLPS